MTRSIRLASPTWLRCVLGIVLVLGLLTATAPQAKDTKHTRAPEKTPAKLVAARNYSLWDDSTLPQTPSQADPGAVELGVKIVTSVGGTITALRFYKGAANTGTHIGSFWSSTGQLLARATFTSETAQGWQQVALATPVSVRPDTTYVASYFAPNGGYAVNQNYFVGPFANGPLTALAGSDGVYRYSATPAFPTTSYRSSNYWVDVVFTPFSGNYSLWDDSTVPQTPAQADPNAVEVGVKFSPTVNGSISGLRFYKGAVNTGTHIGSLWSSTGQLLARATFTSETAQGWQQVTLAAPVAVRANTTYVASYFAPQGRYAVNQNYFVGPFANGPLTAPAGTNGIYAYSATPTFPTTSYRSSNYWVDVVFTPCSVICIENAKTGNPPSEWDISGGGSANIQGYATQMSVNKGETVDFKVITDSPDYRLDVYRTGYYGGLGARKITTLQPSAALPQTQPPCLTDPTVALVDCGNWAVSASWAVPADAVSGVYIAKLVREDATAGSNQIFFVVRDDNGFSDILLQTSDATWQAYNKYGGSSLYSSTVSPPRANKVSYNRPFTTRCCSCCDGSVESWFFDSEYPMIRWIEANGYDVSYTTNVDTTIRPAEILEHRIFTSSGHDEYWSNEMRDNVEAARDSGVNLTFFSGNEVFWKTRWESALGTGTPFRTLVCYKETLANAKIDPSPQWTGSWRDPRFSPPSNGGRPENTLTGTSFQVNGLVNDSMDVPYNFAKLRLWRSTSVATLSPGQTATFQAGILGYEWDRAPDDIFAQPGLIRMSETTRAVIGKYLIDSNYGSTYGSGNATHHLTLYKHGGNALVFGAGTTQWAWLLDATHDRGAGVVPDVRIQQATVNLFADMGVQPGTPAANLIVQSAAMDTTPPTSTITNPASPATANVGTPVLIQGTATDVGGAVGAVEISLDDGVTWLHANGMEHWQYAWTPKTVGTVTIRVRATDSAGNLQTATPASRPVTVSPKTCPCTLFTPDQVPSVPAQNDTNAVEVGVKFTSTQAGSITGMRFYKGTGNTGTHVGSLWSATGELLARATFTNETTDGWQQVDFATPVSIAANTVYVASYYAPNGRYAVSANFFTSGYVNDPLRGPAGSNGVYQYAAVPTFPTSSYQSTNYWVDVVFAGSPG
jgi:hypothetical protein